MIKLLLAARHECTQVRILLCYGDREIEVYTEAPLVIGGKDDDTQQVYIRDYSLEGKLVDEITRLLKAPIGRAERLRAQVFTAGVLLPIWREAPGGRVLDVHEGQWQTDLQSRQEPKGVEFTSTWSDRGHVRHPGGVHYPGAHERHEHPESGPSRGKT